MLITLTLIRVIHNRRKLAHHSIKDTMWKMASAFTLKISTSLTMALSLDNSFNQKSSLTGLYHYDVSKMDLLCYTPKSSWNCRHLSQQWDWGALAVSATSANDLNEKRQPLSWWFKVKVTGSHNPAQPGRVSGYIQGNPHKASALKAKHVFQ